MWPTATWKIGEIWPAARWRIAKYGQQQNEGMGHGPVYSPISLIEYWIHTCSIGSARNEGIWSPSVCSGWRILEASQQCRRHSSNGNVMQGNVRYRISHCRNWRGQWEKYDFTSCISARLSNIQSSIISHLVPVHGSWQVGPYEKAVRSKKTSCQMMGSCNLLKSPQVPTFALTRSKRPDRPPGPSNKILKLLTEPSGVQINLPDDA